MSTCARNGEAVDSAVADLKSKGVKAFGQAVDVADTEALTGWINASATELGGIDALVCNVSALAVGNSAATFFEKESVVLGDLLTPKLKAVGDGE